MRTTFLAMALAASVVAGGCAKTDRAANNSTPPASGNSSVATADGIQISPEDLGKLGARMNRHPSDAGKLLAEQGLSEAAFERAIRKVSSDPAASKRYAAAYKSAI